MTQLAPARMELAEQLRTIWSVSLEEGTPFEALMDPAFWAHVSAKLRPRDRLEVEPEDGSFYAELIVLDAGKLYARVAVLLKVDLGSIEVSADFPRELEVKFRGVNQKWCVVRRSDKSVLKFGLETSEQAISWAMENWKNILAGIKADRAEKEKAKAA